jgi:crotonobetainyl-CoA:carnitine CoA-transferase CaiB-like acyl-CoA transferase
MTDTFLPLAGVRVIEFSHMVMGPTCGLILADLGADVIKIEPPGKPGRPGDPTRYLTNTGAGFFAAFNRNKQSVILDVDSDEGARMARRLVAGADVLIENFRPGGLEGKGLGYAELALENPRLVYCSLKGFLPGPYEQRTALDEVVQMMSGLAYMTGPVGRPLRAGAPVNDMMGGMFGAIAVLAALRERDRTGRGQHVQSGLFENAAWLVSTHMMQFALTQTPLQPMSAGSRAWGIYDVFETRDGIQLFIGVVTDRQWEIFTRALGEPELLDPAWGSNTQRAQARPTLIPIVAGLLKKQDAATLEKMCEAAGLPFARVQTPAELFDDPHLNAGGMVPVTLRNDAPSHIPALPIRLGDWRPGRRRDIPAPGEHNAAILDNLNNAQASTTPGGNPT